MRSARSCESQCAPIAPPPPDQSPRAIMARRLVLAGAALVAVQQAAAAPVRSLLAGDDAEDAHDHGHGNSCACAAEEDGWAIECIPDSAPIADAVAHLEASCSTDQLAAATDAAFEECHKNYLIFQTHHDHCPHHVLSTEFEGMLHKYEHSFDDCYIGRQFDEQAEACGPVDCTDKAAMKAATKTLEDSCADSCASDDCKAAIQLVLMAHDTCDESQLDSNVEIALHDYEEVCEAHLCNSVDEAFEPICKGYEWTGVFAVADTTHTWHMQKVDGEYADPSMKIVIMPTDAPTEATMHAFETAGNTLIKGDCKVVEDGDTMTPIAADGSCFEMKVGTGAHSKFTIDTEGRTGVVFFTAHVPTEFEDTQHYLTDSSEADVEPVAQEGGGGHAHHHHGDHGDETETESSAASALGAPALAIAVVGATIALLI